MATFSPKFNQYNLTINEGRQRMLQVITFNTKDIWWGREAGGGGGAGGTWYRCLNKNKTLLKGTFFKRGSAQRSSGYRLK